MTRSKSQQIEDDLVKSEDADHKPSEQDGATETARQPVESTKKGKKKVPKKKAAERALKELKEQLTCANEQVASYKEQALRAEAEMQNLRKRVARDVENAHKYGTERLLQSLLPTVDSLEKSVESAVQATETNEGVVEGIKICLKMLLEVLTKENVQQLEPEGEPFDPQFHEAISVVEKAEMEPNSVAMVIQKGYLLNGRLVRPAMVIVSKAVQTKGDAAEGDSPTIDEQA